MTIKEKLALMDQMKALNDQRVKVYMAQHDKQADE